MNRSINTSSLMLFFTRIVYINALLNGGLKQGDAVASSLENQYIRLYATLRFGRNLCQSVTCCTAIPARHKVPSSPFLPMNCPPIGMRFSVKPIGKLIHGWPLTLNGAVN